MRKFKEYWKKQSEWWLGQSFEWWAKFLTALYMSGAFLIMGARFDELIKLKLNEMGDLSAGVFGPVAFLWLVLGYFQQGRELKLSSEALQLQADELKASVEQQTIMAAAASKQLTSQQEAFDLQVWRHEQEISPDFELKVFHGLTNSDSVTTSSINVMNRGRDVRFVFLEFDEHLGVKKRLEFGDLKNGVWSGVVSFDYAAPSDMFIGRCYIEYLRADNKTLRVEFVYMISGRDGILTVRKAAPPTHPINV